MVIDLTGVFEDGSGPRAAWVPSDTRRAVVVAAGETVTVRLRVVTPIGVPLVLVGDDEIVLSARGSTIRPSREFSTRAAAVAAARGPGQYDIVIPGADTRYLGGSRGVFDVWLRRASGSTPLVGVSSFVIEPAVVDPIAAAAPALPGAAAPQTGAERSFTWVAGATATTQTVTIPGGGMRDASYAIAAFNLRDPAPGDGPHPDARFPAAGRLAASFQVVTDAPIRAGSSFDVVLRDAS